jgi:hypothetical protein
MTPVRLRTVGLVVLPVAALALVAPSASASTPEANGIRMTGTQAVLMAGTGSGVATAVPAEAETFAAAGATFRVTYHNFSPQAKASFQRAVNVWAKTITSSVPITVDATYRPLEPGVLGSAGPGDVHRNFSGAPKRNVIYVDALANKLAGRQLSASPDIVANFSSSFDNWYFGTGNAPVGDYDFQSVVTHELGHGLGFLGLGRLTDANTGSIRSAGSITSFDANVENGAGRKLTTFADPSTALKNQITGRSLYFDSPAVHNANSAGRARLYAPAEYEPGSSYSHLNESTYRQGTANSLMTPFLKDGETIHNPGPITKAILVTQGW